MNINFELSEEMKNFLNLTDVSRIIGDDPYEINLLTGDASGRTYYRLKTKGSDSKSFVLCKDKTNVQNIESYDFWEVYNFFKKNGIRVPEIYHVDIKKGFLLEEDLGDMSLLSYMSTISSIQEEYNIYENCLDLLIKSQSQVKPQVKPQVKAKKDLEVKYRFADRFFDKDKYQYEIDFTAKNFIERFLNVKFSDIESEIFNNAFSKIINILSEQKMFFTHRDFHSRNIMVKNSELVLIDFQDARMGPLQYDLVSLLDDCYYSLDEENHQQLIKYYWHNFAQEECDCSFDVFNEIYCYMAVQRIYKAIGSFAYIYYNKNSPKYLVNIGRAMERLRFFLSNSDDFELAKELLSIKQILFKYYYGN
ncbi:MAG: phosphotransferase [Oligoflexia bacterium]|nr:phosphotransferase [Oligoflexia bacterium]